MQLPETFKSSGASMLGKILKSVYVEESFTIYDNDFQLSGKKVLSMCCMQMTQPFM